MINGTQFEEFSLEWITQTHKTQRFGQAFLNKFNIACPHETGGLCLFNEANHLKARRWIQSNLVNWKR